MLGFKVQMYKHPQINYALATTIPLLKHYTLLTTQLEIKCKMAAQINEPDQPITFLFH